MGGDTGRAAAVVLVEELPALGSRVFILWVEMPFGAGPSVAPPPLPSWKAVHRQRLSC